MAVTTVFVASNSEMQSKLRLSNLPAGSDSSEIFEEALLEVRANFIRRLGSSRVAEIQTYAFSEAPTTQNGTIRLIANLTEVKWVRAVLMRTLTNRFLDSGGSELSDIQFEGAFRNTSSFERQKELEKLEKEIEESLQILEGSDSIANETKDFATVLEPNATDNLLMRPGESVFTYRKEE